MKTLKTFFLVLTSVFCQYLFGNTITDSLTLQNIVQNGLLNSNYIFEGEVISIQSYWNPTHDYIYTSNLVRVNSLWRNYNNDVITYEENQIVEVITHGGNVGDTSLIITHNKTFLQGQVGIFLCQNRVVPANPNSSIPNQFQLELFDGLFLEFDYSGQYTTASFQTINFQCIDELRELVDPYFIADCLEIVSDGTLKEQRYGDFISLIQGSSPYAQGTSVISFTIENAHTIVQDGNSKLIFDIWGETQYNEIWLDAINIQLNLNANAFGSTPVIDNNVKVYKAGVLLGNSTNGQKYISGGVSDLPPNSNGPVIGFGAYCNPNAYVPYEMNAYTPSQLFRVVIDIQDCSELPEISFTNISDMISLNLFVYLIPFSNSWSSPQHYGNIFATDTENSPMCQTTITSVSPSNQYFPYYVNAGTTDLSGTDINPIITGGDVVTITGNFFGDNIGTVSMRNTDDLSTQTFVPLDNYDILSWANTIIKFRVPSTLPINYSQPSELRVPGSGPIRITTKIPYPGSQSGFRTNMVTSNDEVLVGYSRRNIGRDQSPNPSFKSKLFLSGPDLVLDEDGINSQPGFVFYVAPDVSQLNPKSYPCIQEALKGWVCATSVRFQLEQDIVSGPVSSPELDQVSRIRLGYPVSSVGSSVLAYTKLWHSSCNEFQASLPIDYVFEIDMIISNDYSFQSAIWFDETRTLDQPANKYDFYSIILHEFGHSVLLNHVNQIEDIMKSGTLFNNYLPTYFWLRKINLTPHDILGGTTIVNESSYITYSNCQGNPSIDPMVPLTLSNCTMPTDIRETNVVNEYFYNMNVHPNPFNNKVSFNLTPIDNSLISFRIFSIDGKLIYSGGDNQFHSGNYEYIWEPVGLKSGIYILEVKVNGEVKRIKMTKL